MTTADQWRNAAIVLRQHAAKFDQMAEDQADNDPWHVPPWARPHCSLDPVKMCTSWTCLVDRCARGDDRIAQRFHEEYERLAPMYAWTTQEASAVPWDQLPDNQRRLMCRVVEKLRAEGTISDGQSQRPANAQPPQPANDAIGAERF